MVTFIPAKDDWANAGRQLGSGIATGYQNRSDEAAIQSAVSKLPQDASPRQILDAITNTKTYSPEAKQTALKNYMGVAEFEAAQKKSKEAADIQRARNDISKAREDRLIKQEEKEETEKRTKEQKERNSTRSIINQLDLPEEQKQVLGETASLDTAEDLLKHQVKVGAEGKLTPFEKKVQEKNAEDYIQLSKEIPKLNDSLEDIQYARDLSKELGEGIVSGPLGMATSALGLSGTSKKLENTTFTLLEPIVKIFNPSGVIGQQKLQMIRDKYVIQPGDAPWIRQAKLDALERFAKQAQVRAQERIELIRKYGGNPPKEAMDKFDKESDTISSAMLDYNLLGEEANAPGLPDANSFKGKTITSPDGIKYKSDGTRWLKA